jgi:hypothetical protein
MSRVAQAVVLEMAAVVGNGTEVVLLVVDFGTALP